MPYLRVIALVIVLATIAGCAQQFGPRSSENYGTFRGRWWNYYDRGVWHLANERYAEARSDFEQALAGRTRDAWSARTYGLHFAEFFPNREMGIALYHEGDLDGAMEYLQNSVDGGSESARAWYYIDRIKRDKIAQGLVDDTADPSVAAQFGEGELLTSLDVSVSLNVSDDNGVTDVVVNGERLYQKRSETDGAFNAEIRLTEGEHEIPVQVADLADKSKTETYTVRIDTTAPTIAFQGFTKGTVVSEASYTIRGVALDKYGVTGIALGDGDSQPAGGGTSEPFEFQVALEPGENLFTISAFDAAGNENRASVALYRGDAASPAAKLWWLERRAPERLKVAVAGGPAFLAAVLETAYAQTDGPSVEISFPETPNDPAYRHNIIPIKGSVTAPAGVAAILVANVDVLADLEVPEGGSTLEFKRRVPLNPGENNIAVEVKDKADASAQTELPVVAEYPLIDDPNTLMPIAVLDVVAQGDDGGYSRNEALLVNLEQSLQDRFQVVDRANIDAVLQEQQLSAADLTSVETRLDLGEIVASQFLLRGLLNRFEDGPSQLVVRLTSSEEATLHNFDANIENVDDLESIKRAAADIAAQLIDHFPRVTGQVRQARGSTVIANYSADLGVQPGAFILILKVVEEAFVDETTGEVLMPATYGTAGRAKIDRVQGENTMASVQELEEGFEVGPDIPTITW